MEIFVNMVVNTMIIIPDNFMKRVYQSYDIDLCSITPFETVIFPFFKKLVECHLN